MKNTRSGLLRCLFLLCLGACQTLAVAQEDIYGNVPTNNFQSQSNNLQSQPIGPTAPGSGQFGAPFMGTSALAGSPSALAGNVPTEPGAAEWGPFSVYPHLHYSFLYGNGIEAERGKNLTTAINTVAPGVLLKMGNHWTLDYTPSLGFYSNPGFQNTTDQSVALRGGTTYGDWALSLSQDYLDTTQPLVETGTQVTQEAYATALNVSWQMNDKMSLQLGVNQNFRFAQAFSDLHEWQTSDWLNYQFKRQLGVAIGVTGGFDEVSLGSDMPFEQAQTRMVWQPRTKLSLMLTGGVQDRQFIHPSAPSLFAPIFNASAQYLVRDGTSFTVSGNRTVTPTFFGNEVNVITAATALLHQRIVGKLNLDITGSYTSAPFTSIVPGVNPFAFGFPTRTTLATTRSDTRTSVQFRLSMAFRTRLTGSVFYLLNDNASSQANFNYSGSQVGLDLNYRY